MMGTLGANLTRPVGGAASIFLLGLCFGWVTRHGRSFPGSSVTHALNNLFA
jgi:membrane protease YdiL (CAAX protease family)